MWIEVTNTDCRVVRATTEECEWLRQYLSFEDTGYFKTGRKTVFDFATGVFPGGLLPLVQDSAKNSDITVELVDLRTNLVPRDQNADLAWLRDYQLEAVDACVLAKRGIVRAPTGSGKTEIFVGLTRALPARWLMVVHRDTLITQTVDRYRLRTKQEANTLSRTPPSEWRFEQGLNLMTFQSMCAGIRKDRTTAVEALKQVDGLIVDECHVAPADAYYQGLNLCGAEYRLGFSGTPLDRSDNRSLMAIAALGKVVYSISAKKLIDAGVLALPRVRIVTVKQPSPGQSGAGARAFSKIYNAMIVESKVRNARIVEIARAAPKPCMIFVKQIEHGRALKRQVEESGLSCEFVWGTTAADSRTAAIKRLDRGDTQVLIASVVFQEGVDVPGLESVIVASGGKSVIATLQRVGRGMRTNGGTKSEFAVYDLLDIGSPMLARHSRQRMNSYVREGFEVVLEADDGGTAARYQPKLVTRGARRAAGMPRL